MTHSMTPSIVTEGEACAGFRRCAPATRAIRLFVVAIALAGMLGFALPAGAQTDGNADAVSPGETIVEFALGYVGYPYVWAGNTAAGFDCSGFTQFVIMNTVGINIGHGVPGQTAYGAWVDWGTWQPGDLVFFANTYRAGISHVGIYIGDGQFVHAENESTGVTISSLYSSYYSGHYAGAYRIG